MGPRSREGTSAMKIGMDRNAVRSRGEDTVLEPVPGTGPVPTAEIPRGRDDTGAVAGADAARVRYRKVFACSAGDSPDEEPFVPRIGAD